MEGEKEEKVCALRGVGGPEDNGMPGPSSPKPGLSEQGVTHTINTHGLTGSYMRTVPVCVCLSVCMRVCVFMCEEGIEVEKERRKSDDCLLLKG